MERGGQAGPYGVGPYDTPTIAMGGVIVTLAALAASLMPARPGAGSWSGGDGPKRRASEVFSGR